MIDYRFLSQSLGVLNPPPPSTVTVGESVVNCIKTLQTQKHGCLLVINKLGTLEGIFTERDVVLKVALAQVDLAKVPVEEFMTKNPQTASMTTTVAYALNMMSHGGFRNLPIVDTDMFPVGLISVKNIIDFLAQSIGKMS
jgi:CBS domain-containing protein